MPLPLVDEIRTARAALAEASVARLHLARADAALSSLALVERHALGRDLVDKSSSLMPAGRRHPRNPSGLPPAVLEIPGGDVVAEVAAAWTALEDLPADGPAPDAVPSPSAFAARRAQLERARAHLGRIGSAIGEAGAELNALQSEQHALLATPAYASEHEELHRLAVERDRRVGELVPLQQQLGLLAPTLEWIDAFLARVDAALAGRAADPASARRTAAMLAALFERVEILVAAVALPVTVPAPPLAKSTADAIGAEALWDEVARARDGLAALRSALADQARTIRPALEALDAERARLDAALLERMG